ncbi:hypothetical protein GGI02_003019 [Coemansia sp. RSA 2322]|uniref:DUF7492 domain-containing protein n=1 Tax=Coemansia thaxteri TaxID=2663907 RepID=A0A9W8ELK9_9FUNG|nr:hypothetical protein H4R26_000989 [Coemansia thaxteri]KAJ2470296.1 hypothetical protein GGI02_003019 [Coemansia sp. RSA 2322]KAJ2487850.1 hypothetical protein EV174_000281 [Coemansia sp. RSA 2320]
MYRKLAGAIAVLATAATSVLAHSWVDCVKYDPINEVCLGYPRGYPGRQNVNINTLYTYIFNASPVSQPMCSPVQQASTNYSSTFPMATAQPGETIYTTWEQNGHLDNANPTKVFVYYFPQSSQQFTDVSQRNTAKVAGSMNFATNDNCYVPGYPNTVCLGSWVVPADLVPGQVYHFVWFWYFNANPAGQWYSTCFDVQVNSASHVVQTAALPDLMAKGNPNINYVWGVTDQVNALIANTTMLANPNQGVLPVTTPYTSQPPPSSTFVPVPPALPAPAVPSTSSSTTAPPSAATSTSPLKCIPRPSPL